MLYPGNLIHWIRGVEKYSYRDTKILIPAIGLDLAWIIAG